MGAADVTSGCSGITSGIEEHPTARLRDIVAPVFFSADSRGLSTRSVP
jgi:hypothetical protein